MGHLADFETDHTLRAFITELVDSSSLAQDVDAAARRLLLDGIAALSPEERTLVEEEAVAAYLETCEYCGKTPGWDDMLQTYDTGLCTPCFARVVPPAPAPADDEPADEECVTA